MHEDGTRLLQWLCQASQYGRNEFIVASLGEGWMVRQTDYPQRIIMLDDTLAGTHVHDRLGGPIFGPCLTLD
jgi:hypothetical protein